MRDEDDNTATNKTCPGSPGNTANLNDYELESTLETWPVIVVSGIFSAFLIWRIYENEKEKKAAIENV